MQLLKFLSSLRITVVCLFLLFILTFWGTIAQVQQGLYAAQERFFASFFFLAGGWFPFPGAQLVLWVLFINLICMLVKDFNRLCRWANAGNLITHLGLILYFVAAFFIFHLSRESYVHLMEGESTDVSYSYFNWELAYWQGQGGSHGTTAVSSKDFKPGTVINFNDPDFRISVEQYYPNCDAMIKPKPLDIDKEKNAAGGIFDLTFAGKGHTLLLYGLDPPTAVSINGHDYYFVLRHRAYPLPFTIKLDQFHAEFHPGTEIAKSYESFVTLFTGSLKRQVRIYMNNPLRYKDYTLYQSSYNTDSQGRMYSTLAVVKNSARILPYIACLMVFFGLALHFFIQAFLAKSKF